MYLGKIKTMYIQGYEPLSSRTNGKVERLKGVIGTILGKLLLNKPTKLWGLYQNPHTTTKTSPIYYLRCSHPYLLGDGNIALPNDAEMSSHDERLYSCNRRYHL
jgi:hypothetical protein